MSRYPNWKSTLKKLARARERLPDIVHNLNYLPIANDQIAAIIASTSLENGLSDILRSNLVNLSKSGENELFWQVGPLGNHGTRVKLAYAMGLFGKSTLNDLETIRLIRNAFAHSPRALWFSTDVISTACEKLTVTERTADISKVKTLELPLDSPRKRFLAATNLLGLGFLQRIYPKPLGLSDGEIDLPLVPMD